MAQLPNGSDINYLMHIHKLLHYKEVRKASKILVLNQWKILLNNLTTIMPTLQQKIKNCKKKYNHTNLGFLRRSFQQSGGSGPCVFEVDIL